MSGAFGVRETAVVAIMLVAMAWAAPTTVFMIGETTTISSTSPYGVNSAHLVSIASMTGGMAAHLVELPLAKGRAMSAQAMDGMPGKDGDELFAIMNGGFSESGTYIETLLVRLSVASGVASVRNITTITQAPGLGGCPFTNVFASTSLAPSLVVVQWVAREVREGTEYCVRVLTMDPETAALKQIALIPMEIVTEDLDLEPMGAEPSGSDSPLSCIGVLGWHAFATDDAVIFLDADATGLIMVPLDGGNATEVALSWTNINYYALTAYDREAGELVVFGTTTTDNTFRLLRVDLAAHKVAEAGAFPADAIMPGFGLTKSTMVSADRQIAVTVSGQANILNGTDAAYWLTCPAEGGCQTAALPLMATGWATALLPH